MALPTKNTPPSRRGFLGLLGGTIAATPLVQTEIQPEPKTAIPVTQPYNGGCGCKDDPGMQNSCAIIIGTFPL